MSELHPDAPYTEAWKPEGAIPETLRVFGKFPATKLWHPGDLILTRSTNPGPKAQWIAKTQQKGGYDASDSLWTHAAIYLGDGGRVCEATLFGGVHITPLSAYCGGYVLRVRRSLLAASKDSGWMLAVNALTRLGSHYRWSEIPRLAVKALLGKGFWGHQDRVPIKPSTLICSTLYADAHARTTSQMLGEVDGTCVPAYLSQSDRLQEVDSAWARIL